MDCNLCKLYKTAANPCLPIRGKGKVMFIVDNPASEEDSSGKLLDCKIGNINVGTKFIKSLDKREIEYCITALVKCYTDKDIPTESITACTPYVEQEIATIDPDIIVPMGNKSLKFCLGRVGLTKLRGQAQEIEFMGRKRIIFPMVSYSLATKKPVYNQYLVRDLNTLEDLYRNGMTTLSQVNYKSLETIPEIRQELQRMKHEAKVIVFDTETTGTNPFMDYSKVVCISLTDKSHYGIVIPLQKTDSPFTSDELNQVTSLLKELLEDESIPKVAHNGKFDIKWLAEVLDIHVANFNFDTMLAHYLAISEDQGSQGLKYQAWEFTDMGGYDNTLDEYVKQLSDGEGVESRYNYDRVPWDILKTYAAADVDCCYRLWEIYKPLIDENPKWSQLMTDIMMPVSYALSDIETNGMLLDMGLSQVYDNEYQAELNRIVSKLYNYKEVCEIEQHRKDLFQEREQIKKIPKKDRTEEDNQKIKDYAKYKDYKFNWGSTSQLRELLYDKLGLVTTVLTDKGDLSTNEQAMNELKSQHEIPHLLLEMRKIATLNNMFIQKLPMLCDPHNFVHSSYNLTGTITGRLSSENPNMQQLPRKAGDNPALFQYHHEPKSMFVSRFGKNGAIMNADYCLAPDTEIQLIKHKTDTIKNICYRLAKGEQLYTYSIDPETRILQKSRILRGMMTRQHAKTVKVTLDNGREIVCTPDHKFLLSDGRYVEAQFLFPSLIIRGYNSLCTAKSVVNYEEMDVYDIEVEHNHNFLLKVGVFVHNCALEMRIAAIISNDEKMTQAFLSGADIHKANASYVFKVPIEEVTKDQRTRAKSLGFGELKP